MAILLQPGRQIDEAEIEADAIREVEADHLRIVGHWVRKASRIGDLRASSLATMAASGGRRRRTKRTTRPINRPLKKARRQPRPRHRFRK